MSRVALAECVDPYHDIVGEFDALLDGFTLIRVVTVLERTVVYEDDHKVRHLANMSRVQVSKEHVESLKRPIGGARGAAIRAREVRLAKRQRNDSSVPNVRGGTYTFSTSSEPPDER